jgi:hypothetical protein
MLEAFREHPVDFEAREAGLRGHGFYLYDSAIRGLRMRAVFNVSLPGLEIRSGARQDPDIAVAATWARLNAADGP